MIGKTPTKKTSEAPREAIDKAPGEAICETKSTTSLGEMMTTQLRGAVHRAILAVALALAEVHILAEFYPVKLLVAPQRRDRLMGSPVTPLICHFHGRLPLTE